MEPCFRLESFGRSALNATRTETISSYNLPGRGREGIGGRGGGEREETENGFVVS